MSETDLIQNTIEVLAKTALSFLPGTGTFITEVYDAVKGNAYARRNEKWKEVLEDRLSKTEETLDNLGNNEQFTTALIKANEIAMKTAREEKMKYLANAVVSSLNPDLEEEKLMIFLDLLDKYTISHIKIIFFFNNPTINSVSNSGNYIMGSPTTPLFQSYPELNNNLFNKIYKDLYTDGMVNTENLNITMTGSGMLQKRTTELGDEFLNFILGKQ